MTAIKTAISVEQALFERVEELAEELQISRSRFFSLAAQSYIEQVETRKLIDALNKAYADGLTDEEKADMKAMQHIQAELLEDESW